MPNPIINTSCTYYGYPLNGKKVVTVRNLDGSTAFFKIGLSQNIHHISPEFDWGHVNSGAKQLALAILNDVFGTAFASRYYNVFARDIVAGLRPDLWQLTSREIIQWQQQHNLRL